MEIALLSDIGEEKVEDKMDCANENEGNETQS